ncbi:LexA family protein [Paenibacillus provencensis]|uniref:LexA family protein n=1 Tax=Paenibacillus provencensis TaxID=441151 RepID=A0ABW3PPZ1_9BACL|nr:S24 family peptidase [Paenibacillus sp. MER 78]MCM3128984.1 helix-turn-helix domain-containing protein [Paenibacillus sp. MER 78]
MRTINFAQNLRRIRESKNITKSELARRIEVSDVQIGYWENGKNEPRMGKVQQLADALGVTMDELIYDDTPVIENMTQVKGTSFRVPLYGSIAAGIPLEAIPVDEYIEIPEEIGRIYPDAFLLKVNGDSMNKIVPNGAYALIDPYNGEDINSGDVVAVLVNGYEATLKRFYKLNNTIVLEPDSYSKDFVAKNFTGDQIESLKVIGKMVWFMSAPNTKY